LNLDTQETANKDEVFVYELFVKPSMQRNGCGKNLTDYGESHCKEKRLAGLTLLTSLYMPSKSFYGKNGYTLAEHIVFYYKEV